MSNQFLIFIIAVVFGILAGNSYFSYRRSKQPKPTGLPEPKMIPPAPVVPEPKGVERITHSYERLLIPVPNKLDMYYEVTGSKLVIDFIVNLIRERDQLKEELEKLKSN